MLEKVNEKLVYAVVFAKCKVRDFMYREDGDVNIVSIVVLIGIAIILAIVFRKAIVNLLENLFNQINTNANGVISTEGV